MMVSVKTRFPAPWHVEFEQRTSKIMRQLGSNGMTVS